MKQYEMVVGLETHIELQTKTKIFCGCKTDFGGEPNTHCCPVCVGQPGSLPVLNKRVLEYAMKAGLATHSKINLVTHLDRKNYVYPDLPKAYQISQFDEPICEHGYLELDSGKKIGITRIHIEEDAGKLVHEHGSTYIDYNRGGVPLIEIVSEPDISSPEEAKEYIEKLQILMRSIGISDCKMQEGSLRCDVNISLRPFGETKFGTRAEIKNMNSLTFIVRALEYEYERQADLLDSGEKVVQETRRYDVENGVTETMRGKEDAQDYRYFKEPDLLTVVIPKEVVEQLKTELPELPQEKRKRYIETFGLSAKDASLLSRYKKVSDFFDQATEGIRPKTVANFILGEIFRTLDTEEEKEIFAIKVGASELKKLAKLVDEGKLNRNLAKETLRKMLEEGKPVAAYVSEQDTAAFPKEELQKLCAEAVDANPKVVADYKAGKTQAVKALLGFIMKGSRGKANPKTAEELLVSLIDAK